MFKVRTIIIAVIAQFVFSHAAIAALIGPQGWGGNHIDGFVGHELFPDAGIQLSALDFSGQWIYTAIARESGHTNDIDQSVNAGVGAADTLLTFTTASTANWGTWQTVNFDTENLFFEDSDGPWNVALDPFGVDNADGFKLFQLTQDTTISYLTGNNNLTLLVGDIIVGFNDNHANNSDGDHDDIIVAMRSVSVPAPASLGFFGLACFIIMLIRRKTT